MKFIWSKSATLIEGYDLKKINHENLLDPVLCVLLQKKSIPIIDVYI